MRTLAITALGLALLACGATGNTPLSGAPKPATHVDPNTQYGPLGIGGDYESYTKVSKAPHLSQTHGQRFVEIYVNETGLAAYTSAAEFPVGTTIVKTSWERDGDQPSDFAGPIFVMQKREADFAPDHENWYYAIHWAKPTPKMAKRFGGPFYWQSPSKRVSYCWNCHEDYDREVGLPPKEARAWVTE